MDVRSSSQVLQVQFVPYRHGVSFCVESYRFSSSSFDWWGNWDQQGQWLVQGPGNKVLWLGPKGLLQGSSQAWNPFRGWGMKGGALDWESHGFHCPLSRPTQGLSINSCPQQWPNTSLSIQSMWDCCLQVFLLMYYFLSPGVQVSSPETRGGTQDSPPNQLSS